MYSTPGKQQEETSISMALTLPIDGDRLDSWKEIATHLKRTVRTVQRWERTEALPVHRHLHRRASSVYAWKSEVDQWWRRRSVASDEESWPASSKATPQVADSERSTVQSGTKLLHSAHSIDIGGALGGILQELRGSVSLRRIVSRVMGLGMTWLCGARCLEDINNFWMAHKPQTMSEVYSHLHEELQLRLDEAERLAHLWIARRKTESDIPERQSMTRHMLG